MSPDVPPAASPPVAEAGTPLPVAAGIAAIAALCAIATFRGALAYGFSQDDFHFLAQQIGLAPRGEGPWRMLSSRVFWDLGHARFGLEAWGYHATVLALHAATSATLALLLARRFTAPSALVAAVTYATHPALFAAAYWISANGDVAGTLCLLLATAAFFARGPWRLAAPPAFAAALAFKEAFLLYPLAVAAVATLGPPPRRSPGSVARDPIAWTLAATAIAWALAISGAMRAFDRAGGIYDVTLAAVPRNLLAYAAWTPTATNVALRDVGNAALPAFLFAGTFVAVVVVAGLGWRRWRDLGAAGGVLAWLFLLAPVLPLAHHTYRYYLTAPLAAAAVCVAALFAAASERISPRARWAWAAGLSAAIAVAGAERVRRTETAPFPGIRSMRSNWVVDRASIATRAVRDLSAAKLPPGTSIALWSPISQGLHRRRGGDSARESYYESNVRTALLDGLAIRVMIPAIDSVAFVRDFGAAAHPGPWALYRPDGSLRVFPAAALDSFVTAHGRP